ncbi:hypothetical protein BDW02DRAFT_602366 [Decorospora gaudefroyi]|uniref:Uncharacterized protein n=1 Tax=Decorospora gaudefroyi TaxID=184978 RepID=A0A6A5K4M1_9PLEO|nr:hypothetical protein BDW02DRAFT_602366 [Decorospora gaudefroyi]
MWQLELLSCVVPAFDALAKECQESEQQYAGLGSAGECYADIVNIGLALHISGGEWASDLDDDIVSRLLMAFETRLQKKRLFPNAFRSWKPIDQTTPEPGHHIQFPELRNLAISIKLAGLGGYRECSEIPHQSTEKRQRYLSILGDNISLFRSVERRDPSKRETFLKRLRMAATHLLQVYCNQEYNVDTEQYSLSHHPSRGIKPFADRVYKVLDQHWRCNCPQRGACPTGTREARLSLIRHRHFAPKTASDIEIGRRHTPAKFEILLPVCKQSVEWKITNIEVKDAIMPCVTNANIRPVNYELCQYLRESDDVLQVNFLLENDGFWHLKPELLEDVNYHTTMESLQQLLGHDLEISTVSKCSLQEQLVLCYVLASSLLYLYPSSWLSTDWSCSMVHFVRRANCSSADMLNFPYVSVKLQDRSASQNTPDPYWQGHQHPAILALGIIFLEILTGRRFRRSEAGSLPQQRNENYAQAMKLLKRDQHQDARRLSPGLSKVIRACLKLEPPPSFPSNQLSEEGPIRHYILSCIVGPLAHELENGHKVSLKDLHTALLPEWEREDANMVKEPRVLSRRSTVLTENVIHTNKESNPSARSVNAQDSFLSKNTCPFAERYTACLYRDREELVDIGKINAAATWFDWHNNALSRIKVLRGSVGPDSPQVKIAILDSGIELPQSSLDMYDTEPQIQYRSWVDDNPQWRDEAGHGTHLAVLLRKIAPSAIVHVGRVFKKRPTKSSADTIAKAIRYAVDDWRVHIIVMSFGFGENHDSIDGAIDYAAYKKVLMFAAASNDGKNRPDGVAWPAQDDRVICVHSGDGNGNPSGFTPDAQDGMRVMVLGECVNSASPSHLKHPNNHHLMSGTSCAAPIAAGIAALILDYARSFLTQKEWEKLRRIQSIRNMFGQMKDPMSRSEYWWIKHWAWFDPKRDEGWIQGEIRRLL